MSPLSTVIFWMTWFRLFLLVEIEMRHRMVAALQTVPLSQGSIEENAAIVRDSAVKCH